MEIPKSALRPVLHPEYVIHTFTSLGAATGYSRSNIHLMYARGLINVICSRVNKMENILLVTHAEVERLRRIREAFRMYGSKQRLGLLS